MLCLLIFSTLATNKSTYKSPNPRDVASLLLSLFAIALLVERTIAVLFSVLRTPAEVAKLSQSLDEMSYVQNHYEPPGDLTAEKTHEVQACIAAEAVYEHVAYAALTEQYVFMVGTLIGLLLSISGVSTLNTFVSAPVGGGKLEHLFYAMDALLTAGAIGGGSKGIHSMATAIFSFLSFLKKESTAAVATRKSSRPAKKAAKPVATKLI